MASRQEVMFPGNDGVKLQVGGWCSMRLLACSVVGHSSPACMRERCSVLRTPNQQRADTHTPVRGVGSGRVKAADLPSCCAPRVPHRQTQAATSRICPHMRKHMCLRTGGGVAMRGQAHAAATCILHTTYLHTPAPYMYTCIYRYTGTCIHAYRTYIRLRHTCVYGMHICMQAEVWTCEGEHELLHTHKHTHNMHMYMCMHTCIYACRQKCGHMRADTSCCKHICMCMYTCIYSVQAEVWTCEGSHSSVSAVVLHPWAW